MSTPEQSEEINMSENALSEESPKSNVKQSEEINMSENAEDEEPSKSDVKQSEENDFLELEIQRHGTKQANWKHWQPDKSSAKFIFKLGLLVLRLETIKC